MPTSKTKKTQTEGEGRYLVVRDTREQQGHGWTFAPTINCAGTVTRKLDTGDYTIQGHEDVFCIERKKSIAELAANLSKDRFEQEIKRFADFRLGVILCEFDFADLMTWPHAPGMTKEEKDKIPVRINRWFLLQRLWELQIISPNVSFLFAGRWGREAASSLFKRVNSGI